ncbi:hypothetical protein C3L33_22621, partial [Rhododendron williamsianum]
MMVRDDVEQGSKAVLQTSIRALPADEWRRVTYLGGSSDSFWRKAEAFVPETEIPEEPLSLVPEVPHEEADLIPPSSVLRFRVERGDIPCCFVNYEAVSQAPAHWGDWVESILDDPAFVHTLTASRVLEPVRLSAKLSIRRNNHNIDFMDTAVMMRLSTRGSVAFDPSNLSSADARLVDRLRRAYTAAGKCGSRFDREGRVRAPSKSGKTSWGCWLRYFFKDLPPPGTVPPVGQATEFHGKMFDSDLHLAGFLVYWLSFFVIPDFPYEGPNHTVFPLAVSLTRGDFVPLGPLFLGSLFHRLDQVHADTERSLGRYDMVSVVHTQFLMAFCFEHFPSLTPSLVDLSWNDRIVDFQTEGVAVSSSALSAFAAACPVARQFGYDQGAPAPVPPLKSYAESLHRFTRAHVEELAEGYDVVVLPRNDRETFFTANCRLAWRRNLDSFINYVHGAPGVPALSDGYHRDVSLRSPKARQPGWRGKRSRWAPPSATPAASRDITIAEPISTVIPPRMTRAKAREQSSSQQQGLQLKRLQKGAPTRAARIPRSEETPASVASAGSSFRYEGGEHTPLSKLKRKRECEETREEGSDSSIDDTAPISQSFKLPRTTQPSPGGTSLAPEADIQQPSSQEAVETALNLLDKRINVPPTGDLTTHFQAHDAAAALANLTAAEVFADLQDDSFISLGISQTRYAVGDIGEGSSLLASESASQQQVEANTSRKHAAADDDAEVQMVDPPMINEVEELSNEAFFGYYGFILEATSFLSFVRDLFPYTFFKIEEIGLTVQNFDKLGFDIWWVYKELEAAKVMRENEQLRMDCEGAKAALEEARVALAEAQNAVAAAEAAVEERRLVYERLAEEARLGDRLVDVPLRDTDPFLKNIFGFGRGFAGFAAAAVFAAAAAAGGGWAITSGTAGGTTGATGRAAVIASMRAAMAAII